LEYGAFEGRHKNQKERDKFSKKQQEKKIQQIKDLVQPDNLLNIDQLTEKKFEIISIYLNETQDTITRSFGKSIGVHLHVYYIDQLDNILNYLGNIPALFNLYISVPNHLKKFVVEESICTKLPKLQNLQIEDTPNRGRDVAPFIIRFGKDLLKHDIILHIHTKKSAHNPKLNNWAEDIYKSLLGSEKKVETILSLLCSNGKYIYPTEQNSFVPDPTGWGTNFEIATKIISKFSKDLNINNYRNVRFPQGNMFWCTKEAAKPLLNLPLTWEDFPEEPLAVDGTIAHALERLTLVFAESVAGKNYKILNDVQDNNRIYYEFQNDYRKFISRKTIKILAYYLPQFHSIP
jgi:lipopolysaccharide biosynthesis protein